MDHRYIGFLVTAAMALGPGRAMAQATTDSVRLRDHCRRAEQILRTGEPAPKHEWAIGIIGACPQAGQLLGEIVLALRKSDDTVALERMLDDVQGHRSPELWGAALQLASDSGAAAAARAYAFHILLDDLGLSLVITNQDLMHTPPHGACAFGRVHGLPALAGPALPGNYVRQTLSAAQAALADPATPGVVRSAAGCTQLYSRIKLGIR